MEIGAKFLPWRRQPQFRISSYFVNSVLSVLRRGRSRGNGTAGFCFNPLHREQGTNPLGRLIDLVTFELLKVKSLRISHPLVHMWFLWFSSLSDVLKLRRPYQPDKVCRVRHLPFTRFQFANHKASFSSSLSVGFIKTWKKNASRQVCGIISAFCETAEMLCSILLSILQLWALLL